MMNVAKSLVVAAAVGGALAVPAHPARGAELAVAAPASLLGAMETLNRAFEAMHAGTAVRVSTGSSGALCAQIQNGAPFDVFLSADLAHPQRLVDSGDAEAASLMTYACGALVLWTTTPGVEVARGLAVLTEEGVARVAIANPDLAPYGAAARAALEHEQLWDLLADKRVLGENVAQAAQFVQTGNAQAGLVARALVVAGALAGKGTYWSVPADWYPPLAHGAVITRHGRDNPLAGAYLEFLRSESARRILQEAGLDVPPGADGTP